MTAGYMNTPKSGIPAIDTFLLLQGTCTMFGKALERRLYKERISAAALEIMLILKGGGPQSAYQVALSLGREHHSVVEIVNRLKAKGLIEREGKSILLTPEGDEIIEGVLGSGVLGEILPNDKQLVESLTRLRASLMQALGCTDRGIVQLKLGKAKAKKK